MNDNNPKIGPEVSRRGFLKGAAIAGVSVVLPAAVAVDVETGNETTRAGSRRKSVLWVTPALNVPSWASAASISAPLLIRLR